MEGQERAALLHCGTMYEPSTASLGALTLLNSEKEVVQVSSLWADQTAVLVFLRHFG